MRYLILIVAVLAGFAAWYVARPNETLLHGRWDLDVEDAISTSRMPEGLAATYRAANTGKTYLTFTNDTVVTVELGHEWRRQYKIKMHGDPCQIIETSDDIYQYCVVGDTLREKVNGKLGLIYRRHQ